MCGRCAATVPASEIKRLAGAKTFHGEEKYIIKYNCSPQCFLPCIMPNCENTAYDVRSLRWGLVPSFASSDKDYKSGPVTTINARSENLKGSPLWRRLLKKRCVVVVQGYYEWNTYGQEKSKLKTPFFIHHQSKIPYECLQDEPSSAESPFIEEFPDRSDELQCEGKVEKMHEVVVKDVRELDEEIKDEDDTLLSSKVRDKLTVLTEIEVLSRSSVTSTTSTVCTPDKGDEEEFRPLLLAGLYDEWCDEHGNKTQTCTILTMSSDGLDIAAIHDRAPVFLNETSARLWLSKTELDQIFPTVKKISKDIGGELTFTEVSPLVSNVKNEHPDCILSRVEYNAKKWDEGLGRFGGRFIRRAPKRQCLAEQRA